MRAQGLLRRWLVVVAVAAACAPAESAAQTVSNTGNYVGRISGSHRFGEGIGFDEGYSTIEWMMPLFDGWDDSLLFMDARGIVSDDQGRLGSNVGVGYRQYEPVLNRTFGAMAYWDSRYAESAVFQQMTVGVETLGQFIDARAFAYVPGFGHDAHNEQAGLRGNALILGGRSVALTGGTAEVGVNLPEFGDFQVSGFGGYYRFEDEEAPTIKGWSARAEVWWRDAVGVDFTIQDDDVFGRTTSFAVVLSGLVDMVRHPSRTPMGHMFGRTGSVESRLGERVRRLENIVTYRVRDRAVAEFGGAPLNFLHVDSDAAVGGDGTLETPYNTIAGAMADADAATSIIYTPNGGAFTENVTMTDGARLLSNGPAQFVETQLGTVQIPGSGTTSTLMGLPTLTGDLALGNNNIVSGFDITGDVTGAGIVDTRFMDSVVSSGAGDAISISGGSDNIQLSNLELSAGLVGLRVDDSSVVVSDTTITTAGDDGVEVSVGATDRTFNATNLTVSSAAAEGVDLNVTGVGSLTAAFTGANSISATGNAFDAALDAASTGDMLLELSNTALASTSGIGINLDGSPAGTGTLFVSAFGGNSVTMATGGGVLTTTVTFDSDPATAAIEQVTATSLTIGDAMVTNNVTGDGFRLIDPTGDLSISSLQVANDMGTGLFVDTKGGGTTFNLVTGGSSSITTTNGAALNLDPLTVNLQFASLESTGSSTSGILLDVVSGNIVSRVTTVNGSTNPSIIISNTPAPFVVNLGDVSIQSTISTVEADNIDTTTGNGANLTFITESLTITMP